METRISDFDNPNEPAYDDFEFEDALRRDSRADEYSN